MTDNVKSLEEDVFFNPGALLPFLEEKTDRPIHQHVCPECGSTIPTVPENSIALAMHRAYTNFQFHRQRSLATPSFMSIGIIEDNQEITEIEET